MRSPIRCTLRDRRSGPGGARDPPRRQARTVTTRAQPVQGSRERQLSERFALVVRNRSPVRRTRHGHLFANARGQHGPRGTVRLP